MDELQSVLLDSSFQQTTGLPGSNPVNPLVSPLLQNNGGALGTPTLPLSLLQPSTLNDATVALGKVAIAPTPELRLAEPFGTTTTDSLTGKQINAALVGSAVREIAPPPILSADTAIPNFTVMTEQSIRVNGSGDFDGVPNDLTDDALIYAKTGFQFNGAVTLPVQRSANGNPVLSNGKPLLVNNAVSVSPGYTLSSISSNPYANLVPPSVIDPVTITVPAYTDLKQQEYDRRVPSGTVPVTFNIQQNPITTAAQWLQKFPAGGTLIQPKVVLVTGGALTIPANTIISNTVIILESGNLTLTASGGQTLNNVMLITNTGNVNLNKISSTDLSVFAATSLTMAGAARFSGSTVLANGSATSDITFAGATTTTNASDTLKVVAQGSITYSGALNTRGQFLTAKAFTASGSSTLYGSIKAKGDITFNGSGVVVAIPPTNVDTTAPTLTAALTTDTAPDNTTNTDKITSNPAIAGSVTDVGTVTEFKAGFGNTPVASYANVLADRQANGSFSFSRARLEQINGGALTDGTYTLNLQAKDQSGNLATFALTFTLDTTTATPTLTLGSSSDTGSSNSDRITKIKTPTFSGKAETGSVVKVSSGTQTLGTATANATGDWQLTVSPLSDGNYNVTAISTDVAGNVSAVTSPLSLTIDSLAPQVTLTSSLAGLTTGSKLTGTTNGNGSAIATLTYRFDTFSEMPVTLNASGTFDQIINFAGITSGSHTLTTTATDVAGNVTTTPYSVTVTFDTTPPVITGALVTDTGISNSDRITSNAAIAGSVTDQSSISSFKAGFGSTPVANYVDVSATRQANGSFSLSRSRLEQINGGSLPDGIYTLNLQANDSAGNLTTFALTFTLDTTTATPTATLVSSSDTGISNSDRITKIKTPSLSGKAEAGAVVTVSSGTQVVGTATANGTGDWQLTLSPLNDSTFSLIATSTDAAGNVSGTATPLQVIIDSAIPQVTLTTPTNTPIIPGSNLTGSTDGTGSLVTALTYRFDSSSETAIGLDSAGGFDQAIDLTGITPGNHVLTVTLTDAAGNTSVNTYSVRVNLDITPPVVTVQLANDTAAGTTNSDRVTSDPGIVGNVSDLGQISQLELSFGNTFLDITPDLQTNGNFTLDRARLELLKGSKLADGAYALALRATDASGNVSVPVPLSFTLDTTAPIFPSFQLAAAFDTSPVGDHRTISPQVTLVGQAEANQTVTLLGTTLTTQTDASGQFQFTSIALTQGVNILNAQAVDAAGNTKTFSTAITRMSQRDMVLDWNAITLQAIQTGSSNPPKSSRGLGMVQAAVYDAANAVDGTHEAYYSAATAPAGTSAEAAVAAAAHQVLVSLYPSQTTALNAEYASALATIPDGIGKTQGMILGEQVAQDILNWRSTDGSDASSNYIPGTAPGQWQPTSAASALLPEWGNVTPFALTSGSQFRPGGAPSLTSPQYTTDFNQVKDLGRVDSITRTAEQTEIAKFWADGAGTDTPPGHWNTIAANAAITQGLTLAQEARLFALLDISLADAGIAAWDAKYTYNFWRPVTAIQGADSDGNAATVADATWTPLINTPPFPEYVSGHSTYSGAADAVLTNFFGSNVGFTAGSGGLSGVTRTFDSFTSAANEAGISRIYGGIHFNSANQDGLTTGRAIGSYVASNFLGAVVPTPQLQVGLANDTAPGGVTNGDGITSDATISGSITNAQVGMKLKVGFGNAAIASFVDVTSSLGADGQFTLNRAKLEQILGQALADGTQTVHLRLEGTAGTLLVSKEITLTLDTSAPVLKVEVPLLGGDHSSRVRLIGTATDLNGVVATGTAAVDGQLGSALTIDSNGKFDQALATAPLSLGAHQVQIALNDQAGNVAQSLVNFNVSDDFTVTNGAGWGAKAPDPIILEERNSFLVQTTLPIQLGQAVGSRKLRFEVDAQFDKTDTSGGIEDTLLVYLVDANNPAQTLLDRGEAGTAFFSLTGTKADFTPGLVTFDGSAVEVDLTKLQNQTNGVLRFQLMNIDGDSGSRVTLKNFSNEVDLEGSESPIFSREVNRATVGGAMNLTTLAPSSDLNLQMSRMTLDATTGKYTADVQVKNAGAPVGRQMALKLTGLPAGVQLLNASGVDASGNPYINLRNAIQPGGLDRGAVSDAVQIVIDNPNNIQFDLQPTLLTGGANQAPVFNPVGNLTVTPGGHLEVPLVATDPDGDSVIFSYRAEGELPTGTLNGSGSLIFNPKPGEVGTYSLTLIATDGGLQTEQTVTITVAPDPVTTTRISGVIQNTSKQALADVTLDLGGTTTTTAADGSFQLEFVGAVPSNTLKILIGTVGTVVYPSIAEKLPLLLGHDLYNNVNNVIARPIYLPPIDMANAKTIDPDVDATVTTTNIEGASVFVAAGSLNDQQGNPYTGQLSITEVPVAVTPAALPENLHPDLVVTIQPGEMVFTTPAPLSLPNRAGYAPGALMELWSINPVTGNFDAVGKGQVSSDGAVINTIEGGIHNSSWHFFTALPPELIDPGSDPRNAPPGGCGDCCGSTSSFTSEVDSHSGAVLETHNLTNYQSLGQNRGLTLTYDSLRADSRPIVHFGFAGEALPPNIALTGRIEIQKGNFHYQVSPGGSLSENEDNLHYWSFGDNAGVASTAIQVDLHDQSSGRYQYNLNAGFFWSRFIFRPGQEPEFVGARVERNAVGNFINVNTVDSPFGSGWGLNGWQELIENSDGSVLLVNGNGGEQVFEKPQSPGAAYDSQSDDFSTLERLADGTFRRTMKDQTIYQFNAQNKLTLMRDRNGNETRYVYDADHRLIKMVDPANLETTFSYTGSRISSITDPAARVTQLEYDANGNLMRVIDPDAAARTWEYDSKHHMIAETDQSGYREQETYDFAGRATQAIRKNVAVIDIDPLETQGLARPDRVSSFQSPVVLQTLGEPIARFTNANSRVTEKLLNQPGQVLSATDGGGRSGELEHDPSTHLITTSKDARGYETKYTYDDKGNVTSVTDEISKSASPDPNSSLFTSGTSYNLLSGAQGFVLGDVDGNQTIDLIVANPGDNSISVLLGNGNGTFDASTQAEFGAIDSASAVTLGDLNGDGKIDLVTANAYENSMSVLLGNGDGTFAAATSYAVGLNPQSVALGDFDKDGVLDVAIANQDDDTVSILKGTGNGSFAAPVAFNAGAGVAQVNIADINQDGNLDLVAMNAADSNIAVLLGLGNGSFGIATTIALGDAPKAMAVADVNGDGKLDVVAATDRDYADNLFILLGEGDGTFVPGAAYELEIAGISLALADVNRDDRLDIIIGSGYGAEGVMTLPGLGDGTFGAALNSDVGENPQAVAVADLDDDSDLDLVTVSYSTAYVGLNGTPPSGLPRRYTYDSVFSQMTSETDELGRQTIYEIDPLTGNQLSMTQVVGAVGGNDDVTTLYTYTVNGLTDTIVDPLGRTTDYDYDALGRMSQVTEAKGTADEATRQFEYDMAGNQSAVIGENGHRTEYLYDAMNRLVKVMEADPDGAGALTAPITLSTYDASGHLKTITDAQGNTTVNDYDAIGHLVRVTEADPDGAGVLESPVTIYEYDLVGNKAAVIDPLKHKTEYRYDARNRLIATTLPDGNVEKVSYDLEDNVVAMTDARGHRTRMIYDARNRLTRSTDELFGVTRFEYDAANQMTAKVDENGHRAEYEFDDLGRQVTVKDPLQHETNASYDKVGNVLAVTDRLQHTTQYRYDDRDRQVEVIDPLNHAITTTYDDAGNVVALADAHHTTNYSYDALNRRTTATDLLNHTTTMEYDATDNLVAITDPLSRTNRYVYDALNRRVSETDPLIHTTKYVYDTNDNLVAMTDALNDTMRYTYDLRDRQITSTDALGQTTTTRYDANGNITSVVDANNSETTYGYDVLDRMIENRNEFGKTRTFKFDQVGNLISSIDRNGREITHTYDANDQEITENWLDGNDNIIRTMTSSYDDEERLTSLSDPGSAYTYSYDDANRLTSVDNAGTLNVPNVIMNYTYDDANRLSQVTDTIAGQLQGSTDYLYDAADRLTRLTQSGNDVSDKRADMTYDNADQRASLSRYSDLAGTALVAESEYTFDAAGRLKTLQHQQGSTLIADDELTYDAADRLTQLNALGNSSVYGYDPSNQLTSTDHSNQADEVYTYDANGNRTNTGYQSEAHNRLLSDGVYNYAYDDEGNIVQRTEIATNKVMTYSWDYHNHLTQVQQKDGNGSVIRESQYTYDVNGDRIGKWVDGDGVGAEVAQAEWMVYDQDKIALTFNEAGNLTHRYLYGTETDEILADEAGSSSVSWALTDHQGTVRDVVDSDGVVQNHITYDSYGRVIGETDPEVNFRYGYTGRERDEETGLNYYRTRYYDPAIGRFISEDSIEFDGNDGNLYRYVGNSPVNGVDPTGELTIPNPLRSLSSALPFNPFDLAERFIPGLRDNTIYRSLTSNIQVAAGEEFAQQSQCWYAQHYVDPSTPNWQRPLYFVGGVLSSLWTPENSDATFAVLSTALTLSGAAARTGPRIGGRGPAPIQPRPLPAPTTPRCCFIAGTEILTVDGEKSIEDIQVGDWVIADDPTTPGDIRAKQVLQTFVREASSVVDLYIDGEVTTVTDEHPFWVPEQGWVAAKDLKAGMELQTSHETVVSVDQVERRDGAQKVYNFEVEGFHTYFVSDLGILVHNACVDTRINIATDRTRFTPVRPTTNQPVSAGFDHILDQHFNRPLAQSRSVFTTSPNELRGILQSERVISSPVTPMNGGQFVRTVDVGQTIGNTALRYGGNSTSTIKVFTDRAGNLITTYPVP